MGVDAQDYDRDGAADLAVTALTGETFPLFRGDGRGAFLEATHTSGLAVLSARRSGWCAAFIDADNDGWLDLFTSNSHVNDRIDAFESTTWKQANSLFRNRGDGALRRRRPTRVSPRASRRIAGARRPISMATGGSISSCRRSATPPSCGATSSSDDHHWIAVRLVGTKSNRDGLGARVTIGPQTRTMTTSVGYASSAHAPLHFGLGARTMVDRIEVVWPSGAKQVVEKSADRSRA